MTINLHFFDRNGDEIFYDAKGNRIPPEPMTFFNVSPYLLSLVSKLGYECGLIKSWRFREGSLYYSDKEIKQELNKVRVRKNKMYRLALGFGIDTIEFNQIVDLFYIEDDLGFFKANPFRSWMNLKLPMDSHPGDYPQMVNKNNTLQIKEKEKKPIKLRETLDHSWEYTPLPERVILKKYERDSLNEGLDFMTKNLESICEKVLHIPNFDYLSQIKNEVKFFKDLFETQIIIYRSSIECRYHRLELIRKSKRHRILRIKHPEKYEN
jgi:hypothetical protein